MHLLLVLVDLVFYEGAGEKAPCYTEKAAAYFAQAAIAFRSVSWWGLEGLAGDGLLAGGIRVGCILRGWRCAVIWLGWEVLWYAGRAGRRTAAIFRWGERKLRLTEGVDPLGLLG